MNKMKKVLLLIGVLFLSGCSVKYNLKINNDLTINESVIAKENKNELKTRTGLDENESINRLYSLFKRDGLNTKISSKIDNDDVTSTIRGSHNSIEEYAKNFTSDLYKEVNVERDGDIVTLTINQTTPLVSTGRQILVYDEVDINIEVPFKVIEHNADSVKKNVYTWNLVRDKETKNIMIKYEENTVKDSFKLSFGNNSFNVKYSFIAVGVIILIGLIIALIVFINNKKNNRV